MNQENQSQEVSLKRMCLFAFCQWKRVLAAALVLAVLLGGIQGLRGWKAANASDPQSDSSAMERYEAEKTRLEKECAGIQGDIDYQMEYLNDSVLMQLDYYDIHEAKASFYIATDYRILPDMEYQNTDERETILNVYFAALTSDAVLSWIAREMGMETRYLKELVTLTTSESRILSIYVWHNDSASAARILELIIGQMDAVGEKITAVIGEHSMEEVAASEGIVADTKLADLQKETRERLEKSETALSQAKAELAALVQPAAPVSAGAAAIRKGAAWTVLGGIAGTVLAAVAACFSFLFGDKVASGEELRSRCGIRLLGGIWAGKKKCDPITAWAMAAEGRISRNSEDNLDLIAANISNYCGAGTVLLAGDTDGSLAKLLQPRLDSAKLLSCGSLLASAAAVRLLPECGSVLLVEMRGISRYSEVTLQMERIRDAGKPLAGCIIAER